MWDDDDDDDDAVMNGKFDDKQTWKACIKLTNKEIRDQLVSQFDVYQYPHCSYQKLWIRAAKGTTMSEFEIYDGMVCRYPAVIFIYIYKSIPRVSWHDRTRLLSQDCVTGRKQHLDCD